MKRALLIVIFLMCTATAFAGAKRPNNTDSCVGCCYCEPNAPIPPGSGQASWNECVQAIISTPNNEGAQPGGAEQCHAYNPPPDNTTSFRGCILVNPGYCWYIVTSRTAPRIGDDQPADHQHDGPRINAVVKVSRTAVIAMYRALNEAMLRSEKADVDLWLDFDGEEREVMDAIRAVPVKP